MNHSDMLVRNYQGGDEESIIDLWKASYASLSGYVPRTVKYWKWCILKRPGVTRDDIFIIEKGEEIIAYSVLGPYGKILELAIDPGITRKEKKKSAVLLIRTSEKRAIERGDESIQVELPYTDTVTAQVLKELDYRDTPGQSIHGVIMNLDQIIEKILYSRKKKFPSGWSPIFILNLTADETVPKNISRLLIRLVPRIQVESDPQNVTCTAEISSDMVTVTRLIFGLQTFDNTIKNGTVKVDPTDDQDHCRTLFNLLKVNQPWYVPLADVW